MSAPCNQGQSIGRHGSRRNVLHSAASPRGGRERSAQPGATPADSQDIIAPSMAASERDMAGALDRCPLASIIPSMIQAASVHGRQVILRNGRGQAVALAQHEPAALFDPRDQDLPATLVDCLGRTVQQEGDRGSPRTSPSDPSSRRSPPKSTGKPVSKERMLSSPRSARIRNQWGSRLGT